MRSLSVTRRRGRAWCSRTPAVNHWSRSAISGRIRICRRRTWAITDVKANGRNLSPLSPRGRGEKNNGRSPNDRTKAEEKGRHSSNRERTHEEKTLDRQLGLYLQPGKADQR